MNNNFLKVFESCDEKLKDIAFTHSSYANAHKATSNERLEYLGDSVLGLIVGDYLYNNYPVNEGKLTKVRSTFVCTQNLSKIAKELGIKERIKVGSSLKNMPISDAILEDTVESMIAVIYLCKGLKVAYKVVTELLDIKAKLKKGVKPTDYKSELIEYAGKNKLKIEFVVSTYVTKGGQTNFKSGVRLNGEFYKYGTGSTKREADQNASRLTLKHIAKQAK
ncbi:MAG: ribonuclease III [Clostridia bacterium]|nr:ribonuclease III [Clostridia bacterium]